MSESESSDSSSTEQSENEDEVSEEKPEESTSKKRQHDEAAEESAESDTEWIGPMPTEAAATPAKKKKGLLFDRASTNEDFNHSYSKLYTNFSSTLRKTVSGKSTEFGMLREKLHASRCDHTHRGDEDRFCYNIQC